MFRPAVLRANRTAGNVRVCGSTPAPPHLREPVRGRQHLGAAGGRVDGAREPDDDRTRLHTPLREGRTVGQGRATNSRRRTRRR